LSRLRITQAKRTEERAWLADVSAVVLQQSLRDLDAAYKSFFDSLKGKRQGRKVGPPRYKSKKDTRQSIRLNTNAFSLQDDGTVYVAKVGHLKVKWSRRLPAAPTSLTIIKDSSGRYFLSFVVDTAPDLLPEVEAESDRTFPSSQICSACGFRDGPKPLHVRSWTCSACGTVHDRDHNAAHNVLIEGRRIVAAGRAETLNACGAQVRRAHVPAQRGEAGSPRKGHTTQTGITGL